MSTWARFAAYVPEVAAVAKRPAGAVALDRGELLAIDAAWFAIAYLYGTARRRPRLHPFCPMIAGGRLFAAIPALITEGTRLAARSSVRDPRDAGPGRRRALHQSNCNRGRWRTRHRRWFARS